MMPVMSKVLYNSCDYPFVVHSQRRGDERESELPRHHLIDAMAGTLIVLNLKGQMEITNTAPKMCWWCPMIMVRNKLFVC